VSGVRRCGFAISALLVGHSRFGGVVVLEQIEEAADLMFEL
jgi:hypothetical protein